LFCCILPVDMVKCLRRAHKAACDVRPATRAPDNTAATVRVAGFGRRYCTVNTPHARARMYVHTVLYLTRYEVRSTPYIRTELPYESHGIKSMRHFLVFYLSFTALALLNIGYTIPHTHFARPPSNFEVELDLCNLWPHHHFRVSPSGIG
jgi:hypothetical protein